MWLLGKSKAGKTRRRKVMGLKSQDKDRQTAEE
jgi:hypothetical protein